MNEQNNESFQNLNGDASGNLNQNSKDGFQKPGSHPGSLPMFASTTSDAK